MDASVVVKWIAAESDSDAAVALLDRSDLTAPHLLLLEVGNAIRRKVRDGELTSEQARLGMSLIVRCIDLRTPSFDVVMRAFDFALSLSHPIYDCVYLALAESMSSQVATFDDELGRRAREHGLADLITVMSPGRPLS